jgi:hypothetical protein
MADISTNELSVNMATIFLRDMGNEVQGVDVVSSEDFNIMKILYHNVKETDVHLKWQKEKWKPMIQKAINEGKYEYERLDKFKNSISKFWQIPLYNF